VQHDRNGLQATPVLMAHYNPLSFIPYESGTGEELALRHLQGGMEGKKRYLQEFAPVLCERPVPVLKHEPPHPQSSVECQ